MISRMRFALKVGDDYYSGQGGFPYTSPNLLDARLFNRVGDAKQCRQYDPNTMTITKINLIDTGETQ